jgi:hypothetical protein
MFLPTSIQTTLTDKLLSISSPSDLQALVKTWRHSEAHSSALYEVITEIQAPTLTTIATLRGKSVMLSHVKSGLHSAKPTRFRNQTNTVQRKKFLTTPIPRCPKPLSFPQGPLDHVLNLVQNQLIATLLREPRSEVLPI